VHVQEGKKGRREEGKKGRSKKETGNFHL